MKPSYEFVIFSFSEEIGIWNEILSDKIFWKIKDFLSFDSFDMESNMLNKFGGDMFETFTAFECLAIVCIKRMSIS